MQFARFSWFYRNQALFRIIEDINEGKIIRHDEFRYIALFSGLIVIRYYCNTA